MNKSEAYTNKQKSGFVYVVDHFRNGQLLTGGEPVCNLMPEEGLNHALDVLLKNATQQVGWYIGLYEGDYVPIDSVTAGTVVAAATECTAYDETARPAWVGGTIDAGFVTNVDNRAVFTMNDTKTVYGAFMISSSIKSSGVGVLISIVRFPTVKEVEDGDILRVRAQYLNVSVE